VNRIYWLIFVMGTQYVYCEVGTEIICIADIKIRLLRVKGILGLERHLHEEFTNATLR